MSSMILQIQHDPTPVMLALVINVIYDSLGQQRPSFLHLSSTRRTGLGPGLALGTD